MNIRTYRRLAFGGFIISALLALLGLRTWNAGKNIHVDLSTWKATP